MTKTLTTLAAIACLAGAADAQTAPARGGGLGDLLGSALPGRGSIGSVGAGNAAGLLGYCLQNNLLGAANRLSGVVPGATPTPVATPTAAATGAQSVLQRLMGRQGVQGSPGLTAGQAGKIQTGSGQALSLDGLRGQVKTQACNLVLNRAKSFL